MTDNVPPARSSTEQEAIEQAREINERLVVASIRMHELAEEARAAVLARDDLLAAVSHDLSGPLGTITFSAALLAAGSTDPRPHVERIQRAAAFMQSLIRDLVEGARIGAGALVLERKPCVVAALLAEALDLFAPIAASRAQELEAEIAPGDGDVTAEVDPARMIRVLSNLVGNAIKFTPAGGRIQARLARVDGEIRIAIQDTGPGIAREDLPHLFDRFWQAQRSSQVGAGLGLFIARGLVAAHGGRIWAESELGAGSVFVVALPLSEPARAAL